MLLGGFFLPNVSCSISFFAAALAADPSYKEIVQAVAAAAAAVGVALESTLSPR
jgi:hypothetical protein